MNAEDQLKELRQRVKEASKLPIREAERMLGVKEPSANWLGRLMCKVALHKKDTVPGAGHGERHVGCLRPSCMRILRW